MSRSAIRAALCAAAIAALTPGTGNAAGDSNAGAKLVQAHGCEGCHGAGLKGGAIGPGLFGIEHKMSAHQIAAAIRNPRAPMPNFGFTNAQIDDIVAYLSDLDGGTNDTTPVVTFNPNPPTDRATINVRFPGTPPKTVTVLPVMQMGSSTMQASAIRLTQSATDPHVFTGQIKFSMGGPWTVRVEYGDKSLNIPLTVNG
jgi:hypothetical protein